MKHLLSLEQLSRSDIEAILGRVPEFKGNRTGHVRPLAGQTWAMIFAKSSTRTRVSFEVGIHELGGRPLFLNAGDTPRAAGAAVVVDASPWTIGNSPAAMP